MYNVVRAYKYVCTALHAYIHLCGSLKLTCTHTSSVPRSSSYNSDSVLGLCLQTLVLVSDLRLGFQTLVSDSGLELWSRTQVSNSGPRLRSRTQVSLGLGSWTLFPISGLFPARVCLGVLRGMSMLCVNTCTACACDCRPWFGPRPRNHYQFKQVYFLLEHQMEP